MPELRKDPILGRWVIIAWERGVRPSDFQHVEEQRGSADTCPFCPGNEGKTPPEVYAIRNGDTKPDTSGWNIRVVPNKFPALRIEGEMGRRGIGMYDMMNGVGAHEVIIETTDHTKTLGDLPIDQVALVMNTYQVRLRDLHNDTRFRYVLIFKNEGQRAGASLSHSHSQLIATPVTPKRVKEELQGAQAHYMAKERCIFCDIIGQEVDSGARIVYDNGKFIAFCPYASRFPFEIWLMPKQHSCDFEALAKGDIPALADALHVVLDKLAKALNRPQYNYVLHTSPNRYPRRAHWATIEDDYHWHIEIMPRLTRIAGFEWGTGFYINPTPPEDAAKYLREVE